MHSAHIAILVLTALFLSMFFALEMGKKFALRRRASAENDTPRGVTTLEASVFGLFGLLIAFTFAGAESRFEARRHLIVEETNAIGTAYLRVDLLPTQTQPKLRDLFRAYADARIAYFRAGVDYSETRKKEGQTFLRLQQEIWNHSVEACRLDPRTSPCMLLLPALNEMIDITSTRSMATYMHPPMIIFILLYVVGLICSFLAGGGMAASRSRNRAHILGFAAVMAITMYVILDLEYPRAGLIRVNSEDFFMVDVRNSMK